MKKVIVIGVLILAIVFGAAIYLMSGPKPDEDLLRTGIYNPTPVVTVTNADKGFTADFYVRIHFAPYIVEQFNSEVDPVTLTDFAPLSKPLYKNRLNERVQAKVSESSYG